MNSLPKTVTRQRSSCNLNPGPSAPESSMLTTRLPCTAYSVYDSLITHAQLAVQIPALELTQAYLGNVRTKIRALIVQLTNCKSTHLSMHNSLPSLLVRH